MPVLESPPVSTKPLAGLRVLLAEDADATRMLYESVLRGAGAEVGVATDGLTAFRVWEEGAMAGRPYRLAVVDYGMPFLNGAALTAMLRAAGFSGPIVGMTAGVGAAEESLWRGCGCETVLPKGLSSRDLVSRLAALCGRS